MMKAEGRKLMPEGGILRKKEKRELCVHLY
jgi:hypothetical protein